MPEVELYIYAKMSESERENIIKDATPVLAEFGMIAECNVRCE